MDLTLLGDRSNSSVSKTYTENSVPTYTFRLIPTTSPTAPQVHSRAQVAVRDDETQGETVSPPSGHHRTPHPCTPTQYPCSTLVVVDTYPSTVNESHKETQTQPPPDPELDVLYPPPTLNWTYPTPTPWILNRTYPNPPFCPWYSKVPEPPTTRIFTNF